VEISGRDRALVQLDRVLASQRSRLSGACSTRPRGASSGSRDAQVERARGKALGLIHLEPAVRTTAGLLEDAGD
jgi:hypothetical protein